MQQSGLHEARLERAVDAKIEEQREFVRWWDESVGVRESPGRLGVKSNADLRSISREAAESLTGIMQQQVRKQREFVRWWDESVGVRLHADSKVNADRRSPLSRADAESLGAHRYQSRPHEARLERGEESQPQDVQ